MQQALSSSKVLFQLDKQKQGVEAILVGYTPLVIVLLIGGGKSLLFMAPVYLDNPSITIIIIPFYALLGNIVNWLKKARIDYIEQKAGENNLVAIVVVSIDIALSWGFLNYGLQLNQDKLLQQVVINKYYLTFTLSDQRPKLAELKNL